MENNPTPSVYQSVTRGASVRAILITGGTGTLGHALTDHFLTTDPALHIRIFSRSEHLQQQMKAQYPQAEYMLGDIRDASRVHMACRGMDAVIHAAALKHVDRSEESPGEFLRTNVTGTEKLLLTATATDVQRVVLISSDKAVAPVNCYGATKMLAERLCLRSAACNMVPCNVVRYGNVMGSRGSVVEVFRRAIAAGEPLPVTDFGMTRFHLETHQAVATILAALTAPQHSAVFVPHLRTFDLNTLCHAMLDIPMTTLLRHDIDICLVGRRPGERPYEILMTPEECWRACCHNPATDGTIYRIEAMSDAGSCLHAYRSDTWPHRLTVADLQRALEHVPVYG